MSHAAEEQALNVGESAGSHHDEADVVRRGSIDYGSGHLAHSHIAHLAFRRDPRVACGFNAIGDQFRGFGRAFHRVDGRPAAVVLGHV